MDSRRANFVLPVFAWLTFRLKKFYAGTSLFKGLPTEYVIHYRLGKITAQGLAFCCWPLNTHIVALPTASSDGTFVFNEVPPNFQAVTIQGQFAYRIAEPQVAADLLNFTLDPRTRKYIFYDPHRLAGRIANAGKTHSIQPRCIARSGVAEQAMHLMTGV
jgi:hypothetical protein